MTKTNRLFQADSRYLPLTDAELPLDLNQSATVILGAPGSGKTTTLRATVRELERTGINPSDILVLTPSRRSATLLRDQIALDSKQPAENPRARSLSSFAFSLVNQAHPQLRLLSGAMQQAILQELVSNSSRAPWGFDLRTIGLTGFVQELRDLISICVEHQVQPSWLSENAKLFDHRGLAIAAEVLPKYLQTLGDQGLIDPSDLLLQAAELPLPKYRWVLVDDAQDLTRAAVSLIQKLAIDAQLALFGDPDVSILGFRNGLPNGFLADFPAAKKVFLEPNEKFGSLKKAVAQKIPTQLAGPQRPRRADPLNPVAMLFENQVSESDWIAAEIRKRRLTDELSWDQIAVVGRTRTQLEQIATALAARGVPVQIVGAQLALREQPMARAMLDLAALAFQTQDSEAVEKVLGSEIFGLDAIAIRRLKRQLRALEEFEEVAASELIASAVETEPEPTTFEIRKLGDLAKLLRKIRSLAGSSAHQLVSEIWNSVDSTGLGELSRGTSEISLAADRSIDASLELFASAKRFDQNQLGNAQDFVASQLTQAIPEDSLAPVGMRPAVQLTTASSLLAQRFSLVVIRRLQDGIWPNLKGRGSLLGASSLAGFLAGRIADPNLPVRAELDDELRLFYKAIGAATNTLVITAMISGEEQPSQFFELAKLSPELHTTPITFDLRRLVGLYRKRLYLGDLSVAPVLGALALLGVPGADPNSWQGLLPISTDAPLVSDSEEIRFSPSRLEAFEKCPVHWFIQNFGGDGGGFEASLGTLLHAAMEVAVNENDLLNFVESNWHSLEFEAEWIAAGQKRKALNMVAAIGEYLREAGELVAAEQKFELKLGRLVIAGKIDRVEQDGAGNYLAVDLKTGKPPTPKEVSSHRQLAVYQLAIREHFGVDSAGGRIVAVGDQKLKVLDQPVLAGESETEIIDLLRQVELGAGSGSFVANLGSHCEQDQNCQLLISKVVTLG